jgi:DNA repair protein RAD51
LESVAHAQAKSLVAIKGLSEKKVDQLLALATSVVPMSFTTASQLRDLRKNITFITTGSSALDEVLGGGFETGSFSCSD